MNRDELMNEMTKVSFDENKKDYDAFVSNFKRNRCYECNLKLDVFDDTKVCFHWLLQPGKAKKKDIDFNALFQKYGCFRIRAWLRFLANADKPVVNINDVAYDTKNILEETIRYKDNKWSFFCTPSDLKGHPTGTHGTKPHFHFDMQTNDGQFVKFGENHFNFTDEDLHTIKMRNGEIEDFEYSDMLGIGLKEYIKNFGIEGLQPASNEDDAMCDVQTIVIAEDGYTLSGDDLVRLFQAAKEKNTVAANLVEQFNKHAAIKKYIVPGKAMPEKRVRTKVRTKKKKIK